MEMKNIPINSNIYTIEPSIPIDLKGKPTNLEYGIAPIEKKNIWLASIRPHNKFISNRESVVREEIYL